MFPSTFLPAFAAREDSPQFRRFDNRVFENPAAGLDVASFGDSSDPLAQHLASDPSLLEKFLGVLELLERFDPELGQRFVETLRGRFSVEYARVDIQIEVQTSSFAFDSASGRASLSQTTQSVRIQASVLSIFGSREVQSGDPIVLDLDGNGLRVSGLGDKTVFDLDADGRADLTAFVGKGDGLLALDRNGNGRIDDGSELFGDQRGAANGFEELRKLDANGDGVIDAGDPAFQALKVLKRSNDGRLQLESLARAGVASISLDYFDDSRALGPDARVAQTGSFTRADGTVGEAADVLFDYRPRDKS